MTTTFAIAAVYAVRPQTKSVPHLPAAPGPSAGVLLREADRVDAELARAARARGETGLRSEKPRLPTVRWNAD